MSVGVPEHFWRVRIRGFSLICILTVLDKLYSSHYGSPDDIDHITDCFDKSTKLTFAGSDRDAYVRFGTARDTQPSFDIKFGQLKLEGSDVAPDTSPASDLPS